MQLPALEENPISVDTVLSSVQPGDLLYFLRDSEPYENINFRIWEEHSGTYDQPIVFYGERNEDGSLGVHLDCNQGTTNLASSCFNVESADYIAIDGFEMVGGFYGVRAVGSGFSPENNQLGLALLNNDGHDQHKDPFFYGAIKLGRHGRKQCPWSRGGGWPWNLSF